MTVMGRRCQPFHLSSTPHCCQALVLLLMNMTQAHFPRLSAAAPPVAQSGSQGHTRPTSAGKCAIPPPSPRWRGRQHVRPKSLRRPRAHAVGTRSNAGGLASRRRSQQAARMETRASTWSSVKGARPFSTTGRHLSDLDSGQARLALGMPAACSNASCTQEEVSEQLAGV